MSPVLTYVYAHSTVIMVHEDTVTMEGLVIPLDHPDVIIGIIYRDRITVVIGIIEISQMIGIIYPERIIVVIGIIETNQMIGTTTIEIGITALTTIIGDIKNSNGISPVRNFNDNRYPTPPQNWHSPSCHQGGNREDNPNRYNNQGNGWNQSSQGGKKGQNMRLQQSYTSNQPRQPCCKQQPSHGNNIHNGGCSNYNSSTSLSELSSFVTHDGVTFDARRNQGFPNACTEK